MSHISSMSEWWVYDVNNHRRGPFSPTQMSVLLHLGSISDASLTCRVSDSKWEPFNSCELLRNAIADSISCDVETTTGVRIPISEIPAQESISCQDTSCPKAPGCDVVYIWDRQERMWLTFDEYVKICAECNLTDGLPDRLLAYGEQIGDLLREVDLATVRPSKRPVDDDEPLSDPEKEEKRQRKRAYRERKKLRREAGLWVKGSSNPNVYVSSLPVDVGKEELVALFKQAGQLKTDMQSGESRVKLYGNGDGLVTFMHEESVALAVQLFNEFELRPGSFICVQQADFSAREADAVSMDELRERAQLNRESRRKLLDFYRKERALKSAWDVADYQAGSNQAVVVFANCFDPRAVDYPFLEQQVEQLALTYGVVKKVFCMRDSLDGFVCVRFGSTESAQLCVAAIDEVPVTLQGRPLTAFIHDGRDLASRLYRPEVDQMPGADTETRAVDWEEFLYEAESDDDDIQVRTE